MSSGKGSKPDLVLLNRERKEIALMELTCPLPYNAQAANIRKVLTYTQLRISLEEKGFKVYLLPFKVSSNGHISKNNKLNIDNVLRKFKIRIKSQLIKDLSQISLLCTMSIFHAYQVTDWASPPLLSP